MAEVDDPMVSSFFWANAANGMTIDQLKAQRAVAAAMASRSRPYPKTFGEGLSAAAEGLTQGLYDRNLALGERAQLARDVATEKKARTPEEPARPAGPSAALDVPPDTVAELPPEIDAGRNSLAQTAAMNPNLVQMAALNSSGTMSDAGQPGLTYGGAGPGAPLAQPPDTAPPDASIAAGRDSIVPTMMAQAGGGRPAPAAAPPPGPLPPQGTPIQPGPLPEPGGARITLPEKVPAIPPEPKKAPSPEMNRLRSVLDAPGMNKVTSPETIARLEKSYEQAKQRNDDAHAQRVEIWQKERDDIMTRRKEAAERTRQLPKEQYELTKQAREEAIARRFGDPENYKKMVEATNKRGDATKEIAQTLPQLYEAERMLRDRKIISGFGAQGIGGTINTPAGSFSLPGQMTVAKFASATGNEEMKKQVADTEEFQAKMRPMIRAMLQKTTGSGAISNFEVDNAMQSLGISANLDQESMLRIVRNIRKDAWQSIATHNAQMRGVFDNPNGMDEKILTHNRVEIPPDPEDVSNLRATPNSPEERARFDHIYGAGSARKLLGYGR